MNVLCSYCGNEAKLVRDHVVPRSRGGPDNATNIVMACQPCNSDKSDLLPSEWLGERCPKNIQAIEARVNQKLEKSFAKRDWKKKFAKPTEPEPEYAFHVMQNGGVDFIGEVMSNIEGVLKMEVLDAVMATGCGLWQLSGEIKLVQSSECRFFTDRATCLETALRINRAIWSRTRKETINGHEA